MGWPQIVFIIIMAMHVGVFAAKHGTPVINKNYNVGDALFRVVFWSTLLWFGGFFSH